MNAEEKFWEALRRLIERQEQSERETRALRESIDKLRERQEKTDEQLRKTDEGIKELQRSQDKTDKIVRRLSYEINNVFKTATDTREGFSRFIDGIMLPSAVKVFRKKGYKVLDMGLRRDVMDDAGEKKVAEANNWLDCIKRGQKYLFIGEAKSKFTPEDVEEHIKRLKKIKSLKRFSHYKLIGYVASVDYVNNSDKIAIEKGLYVFRVSDGVMKLSVPRNFKPKEY